MYFPERIDIYIQFGFSASKNYSKAVAIIRMFPLYIHEKNGKSDLHSCRITTADDFFFLISDIEELLFTINNWKSSIVEINGVKSNYRKYVEYRNQLSAQYPEYKILFNLSGIGNGNCSLEKLPLPIVYYPELYGAFFGFSEDINGKIYFCECERNVIENYVKLRKRLPLQNYSGSKTNPLGTDYFPEIISNISCSNPENPLSLFEFKKDLCFLCNNKIPHLSYCADMYGSQFKQKYGWYINQEYFRLGIDPYQILNENILPDKCPTDIYTNIKQYIQLYNQLKQEPNNESLLEALSLCEKEYKNAVENSLRKRLGFKNVGEAWTSETILYHIVKSIYPNLKVIFHYHPKWLNGLELDIFVPEKDIAFEYQGIQHFKPVEHWGGTYKLEIQQQHDKKKAEICKKRGITLITVNYDEELSIENINAKINIGR